MDVILLGAPGAGKGTQGALLTKRYDAIRISTGDLLRDAVRRGSPLGQEAKKYMDAGDLVPDDVIMGLVRETLEDLGDGTDSAEGSHGGGSPTGFIADGFPRTIAQARALDELLEELEHALDAVVILEVGDDTLVKRLSGRRSCAECGAVYNVHFEPPATPGECDRCGGPLVQRADDDAATVRRRLAVYGEQTEAVIEHYERSPVAVHRVDGDRAAEAVHQAIVRALEA